MRNFCLECNSRIIGRSDKKYCSSVCRSSGNNKNQTEEKEYIRNVNARLHRNRIILSLLYKQKKSKVSKEYLHSRGFSFSFNTMQKRDHLGRMINYSYDLGYLELTEESCCIIKLEMYKESIIKH